ncbi:PREDICTED: coiled-coil domain-containing protein 142 [Pseudopodoces humilis]|uniref:coiled-coil domain-containing protein 142 n=1 Tax=Pseudopodoces humilis TaxID=181119 RepID=UPI000395BD14|nr:PREDICTED: coiled-coil domain-containing protein 142 [Pseudopodoces humilis]
MDAGGAERRGGELCLQVGEAGLGGLILLLLTARPGPGDGAARGELPEPGGSRGTLARSLQRAEAMLRSVTPGLRRLLSPRSYRRSDGDDDDDEDEDEAASVVVPLEQTFPGLRRWLCVWEDPRTETFLGYVRPHPSGAGDFSGDAARQRVAERGAALHALLQHRHQLRLARDFTRRLKASSEFLRRLLALPGPGEPGSPAPALRELCLELRAHAGHWAALLRRLRTDAWLRALPQRRGEAVVHMRWALLLPTLMATRLAGRHIEGRLRELGRPGMPVPASECLADLFQGLEMYNRVVQGLAEELGPEVKAPSAFTVGRVLRLLAAERGRAVAQRLQPLLWPQNGNIRDGHVRWEDAVVPWPPGHDAAETGTGMDTEPSRAEVPSALAAELQAVCQEDEELMKHVFGALVASADSLWQPVLSESPEPPGLAPGPRPGSAGGWKAVRWLDAARGPAVATLSARYHLLLWEAAGAVLGDIPGTPPATPGATLTAAWELSRALAVARVPPECQEELGRLCLRLLCRSVLCSWDTDFTRALGSGLSDKCLEAPGGPPGPGCSRTAQQLRCLFPALALALRCLRLLPARPHAPPGGLCLRLQVLARCLAAVAAAHAWLTGRAGRYLAAWALPQFLLLTQGDLQAEAEELMLQVSGTFPEPRDIHGDGPPEPLPSPGSPWELQLCRQIRDVANSIQRFSGDVLWMFSTSCKRLSAEIFDQTMPLGRHWRLRPRAELPSSPSAYAAAAVQAVLGQVLQGAQALPHDAQVPTLARVTTAFLEAWMDHILTRRIKFSLQGALQLRRDFEEVRELVCSESSGLAPEARQALRALCVFRHTDTAVRCLLQQPGGLGGPPRGWGGLRRCCSDEGAHPLEPSMDPLPGLDPLEGLGPIPGTPPPAPEADLPSRPESPFPGSQQQWLSLRLHRARRWRVPGLPCVGNSPEG